MDIDQPNYPCDRLSLKEVKSAYPRQIMNFIQIT